jgi:hypothetical protein
MSTINRANASDTGRRPRCLWRICTKIGDPLLCKTGVMHLG